MIDIEIDIWSVSKWALTIMLTGEANLRCETY